jgi:hypothetical protein
MPAHLFNLYGRPRQSWTCFGWHMEERPDLDMYGVDGFHQGDYRLYLNVNVLYATVFGESPVGLTYTPRGSGITDEDRLCPRRCRPDATQPSRAVAHCSLAQSRHVQSRSLCLGPSRSRLHQAVVGRYAGYFAHPCSFEFLLSLICGVLSRSIYARV